MFLQVAAPELVCLVVHYAAVPRVELCCFDPRRMGRPHGEQYSRCGENVGSWAPIVSLLVRMQLRSHVAFRPKLGPKNPVAISPLHGRCIPKVVDLQLKVLIQQ